MGDEKKTGRWAKSLHKAGLIDDVEESWRLPDNVSITKAKIIVVGEKPKQEGEPAAPGPPDAVSPASSARQRIAECYDVGDYSGCLELAGAFLKETPDDDEITQLVDKCRKVLMQMYESRIGAFDRTPRKAITEEELIWRNLDPLSGFIAATVDGMTTFEDIIDISTVSRFETCRILSQLLQDGIIE